MTGHNLCVYHVFVVAEKRVYIMLLNPLIVVTPSMIVTWLAKKKKKKSMIVTNLIWDSYYY